MFLIMNNSKSSAKQGPSQPTGFNQVPLNILMAHSDLKKVNNVKHLTELSKGVHNAYKTNVDNMMSNLKARAAFLMPLLDLTSTIIVEKYETQRAAKGFPHTMIYRIWPWRTPSSTPSSLSLIHI
jgi:hypothetical protein